MNKSIIPHLWFAKEAKEAADFYVSVFPAASLTQVSTIRDVPTPTGECDIITFEIGGQPFMAINAGPLFKPNPAISFMVNFDPARDAAARENLDRLWDQLAAGGTPLMPLQEYPFSKRYGWIQDKYGLSWQLILTNPEGAARPFIIPSLLFVGEVSGKAEEATDFYLSVFKDSERGLMARYPAGMAPEREGTVMFTDFRLLGTWLAAMDSAAEHAFSFNEAISLVVSCQTQEEINYFWKRLSAVPDAEQCGWLKDKYGLSWQIVPAIMDEMMRNGTREQIDRLTQAFLQMKKFDIAGLEKAYARSS
jgi:predicted 3-demethylubiquinone-9 3-methyltransferase (glyoxalase superfamily)